VFPSSGQTFPLNGSMLFQVQPMSGAHGYLWSFVQNGAVVWQNLAWDGRLGGATYNVGKGSRAEGHMHGGDMQVWVRAWMGGNQWSGLSTLGVRLQGAASGPVQPQPVKPQPVQPTHPAPGTTLYYADTSGGLDKWTGSSDWKHVNGMLVNDGNGSTDRWIRDSLPTVGRRQLCGRSRDSSGEKQSHLRHHCALKGKATTPLALGVRMALPRFGPGAMMRRTTTP